jgi:hypothetical protein
VRRCDTRGAGAIADCFEALAVDIAGGNPNDDIAVIVARVSD